MNKIRLALSLLGVAALAVMVWFAGPLVTVAGHVPLDGEARRIALIAVIVALWSLVVAWRVGSARRADRRLADGISAAPPPGAASAGADDTMIRALDETDVLRGRFREALGVLRQSGRRGAARLSDLPWYVLIGPPGAGKTTALQNSGLKFPLADRYGSEALKGVGGTRQCDWWFSEEAVLIDTAGRYTTQDSDATVDNTGWSAFLALLRRYRRRRPINGVIVAISLEDVATPDAVRREAHARAIRQRIRELDTTLGLRFPVYVMLTKTDRLAGFTEFFAGLSHTERDQAWGMSFAPEDADALGRFATHYDGLVARLNDRMLTGLNQEHDPARRALLFGFPSEVATLKDDLHRFLASLFGATRYEESPWLRGVYLTSATQAGAPTAVAPEPAWQPRGPGAALPSAAHGDAGPGRSFFVADVLRRVIFPEAELVGFNPRHERWRVWLHGLVYGAIALCVAGGITAWAAAYQRNEVLIGQLQSRLGSMTPANAAQAASGKTATAGAAQWLDVLPRLDELRGLVATDGAAASSDLGLRHSRALDAAVQRAYVRELNRVLAPRIAAALAQALRRTRGEADPTYATLKGYLMLSQTERRDAAYLKALLQLQWERDLPQHPTGVARLQSHFSALLAGGLAPLPMDADLVREARTALNRVPLAELAYSRLKREALAHDDKPFVPRDALGAVGAAAFERRSGLPLELGIAGLFTARGYVEEFVPQSQRLTQALRSDIWVLGNERGDLNVTEMAALGDDVGALYAADYVKSWKDLLADLRVANFRSTAQGMDALGGLSGRNSALRGLLLAVDRNTRLAPGGATNAAGAAGVDARIAAKVTNGFQQAKDELSQLLKTTAPTRNAELTVTELRPAARIAAAFADITALVQADKDGRAPLDAVIERLAALYTELGTLQTQDLADPARRPDSPAGRAVTQLALAQPQPLKDWLQQLANGSLQLTDRQQEAAVQKKRGDDTRTLRDKINAAWKSEVLPFCNSAVAHRYPVDRRSANDVTLKDFARLFGPSGLIDSFVKDNLRPFIDASVKPWRWRSADQIDLGASADALRQIETAAGVRNAFFRDGGALPAAEFSLRPLPGGAPVSLNQGELSWVDRAAPTQFKPVHWPAADGAPAINLSVGEANGMHETRNAEGPWAWFRLLDQATLERATPDRMVATFRLPTRTAQIELRASSVVNPFQPLALDQFQCPKGF